MSLYGDKKDYEQLVKENIQKAKLLYALSEEDRILVNNLLNQKEQVKEKELRARKEFEDNLKDTYRQKAILRNENDYYYEYVTEKINEYKSQGKDITPLLIELHKYKKRNKIL